MCIKWDRRTFLCRLPSFLQMPSTAAPSPLTDQQALLDALTAVMAPMARLAVTRGLPFADLEEALKQAVVQAARDAQLAQGLPAHRLVSRISTATGINRREVTRLTQDGDTRKRPAGASLASLLVTRWLSDTTLRKRGGKAKSLPRTGEAPSFEALARGLTQDVHPRSLLDELCRLGMAVWDLDADTVSLTQASFTPRGNWQQMVDFLGANVGDHLRAAADNVLSEAPAHVEQSVFADALSEESVSLLKGLARRHWTQLLQEAVPLLEQRRALDAEQDVPATQRVKLGLYTYNEGAERAPNTPEDDLAVPVRRARRT